MRRGGQKPKENGERLVTQRPRMHVLQVGHGQVRQTLLRGCESRTPAPPTFLPLQRRWEMRTAPGAWKNSPLGHPEPPYSPVGW